jgi:hypothetical protein
MRVRPPAVQGPDAAQDPRLRPALPALQLPKPSVLRMWQTLMELWNDSARRHGILKARRFISVFQLAVFGSQGFRLGVGPFWFGGRGSA